jgi:hypothetical protein
VDSGRFFFLLNMSGEAVFGIVVSTHLLTGSAGFVPAKLLAPGTGSEKFSAAKKVADLAEPSRSGEFCQISFFTAARLTIFVFGIERYENSGRPI